jgi:hypothetical protein
MQPGESSPKIQRHKMERPLTLFEQTKQFISKFSDIIIYPFLSGVAYGIGQIAMAFFWKRIKDK